MPKERVADAVRCNGQNPLNTEVVTLSSLFFCFCFFSSFISSKTLSTPLKNHFNIDMTISLVLSFPHLLPSRSEISWSGSRAPASPLHSSKRWPGGESSTTIKFSGVLCDKKTSYIYIRTDWPTKWRFDLTCSLCERQNKSPKDEVPVFSYLHHHIACLCLIHIIIILSPQLSESLSVFDVDGEGWVPMSHFKWGLTIWKPKTEFSLN